MGAISRLWPWYRWTDRWARYTVGLPDGSLGSPVTWTAPTDYRYQLLSITFFYCACAAAGKRYPYIFLETAQHRYLDIMVSNAINAAASSWVCFAAGKTRDGQTSTASHTSAPLPTELYIFPHDVLTIHADAMDIADFIRRPVLTFKRWRD